METDTTCQTVEGPSSVCAMSRYAVIGVNVPLEKKNKGLISEGTTQLCTVFQVRGVHLTGFRLILFLILHFLWQNVAASQP